MTSTVYSENIHLLLRIKKRWGCDHLDDHPKLVVSTVRTDGIDYLFQGAYCSTGGPTQFQRFFTLIALIAYADSFRGHPC